ncbi:putative phage tail protein [Caudoviricetes sp.]|nr:putative phage tail protein [Caudoviricetes sp.]
MATMLLSAAGNAMLPGIGGVIGGMIGGIIDNLLLFPPPDQKGPRLNDLQFQSSSEGTPTNFVLGNENRVAGWIIWKGATQETEHEQGKGGPQTTTYTYSCSIAIAVCENATHRVPRIWANGNLIYDVDADITIVSTQISATVVTVNEWTWNGVSNQWELKNYLELTSPNGGPDLSRFRSGLDVVVSGMSNVNNNGTFRCVLSTKDQATGISKARLRNQNAVTASSGPTVTLFQDVPEWSSSMMGAAPTFYYGSESQLADPTIQAAEGAPNVPAFRGVTYVVIQNLQLAEFGNAVPQFTFDVEESNGVRTLSSALSLILARSGRPSTDWDVSAVTGNLRGYVIRGPQTVTQQLSPLLLAFDVVTQERRGKLYFFNRSSIARSAISGSKVTARALGAEAKRRIQVGEIDPTELITEINVRYIDTTNDYGDGNQGYRRFKAQAWSSNTKSVDLPITLSPSEAQDIARRILWTVWANRFRGVLTLAPSQISVCENDVITIAAVDGRDWELLVTKVDRGALDYLLELESLTEELQTLTFTGSPAEDASFNANTVYTVPEMVLAVADFGPLSSNEETVPGVYWGAAFYDPTKPFLGASLYQSEDGTTFSLVEDVPSEAVIGYATTALSGTNVNPAYWDYKTTITISLYNGSLESKSDIQVLNGANRAMIGQEIVGFKTASLQSDGTYILSGFLRGLVATESAMTTHVAGEQFMLLSSSALRFRGMSYAEVDQVRYFKVVALGGIVSQFTSRQIQMGCNTVSHFPPCSAKGWKDTTNSVWKIRWTRRTRAIFKLFSPTIAPLLDDVEQYDVEVYTSSAFTTLASTTRVVGAAALDYPTGSPSGNFASLYLKIYQVHTVTGRSKALVATLPIN